MAKQFAVSFYKSAAWEKCRAAYIQSARGLCEDCMAKGRYVPGTTVHHIIPITEKNIGDPSITLSFSNLKLVCQECHAAEHHPSGLRYDFGPDGEIILTPP